MNAWLRYIAGRLAYAIAVLIGVNLITFTLFFAVNTPDDMARLNLGGKRVTPDAIEKWKAARGYNKPLLLNTAASGTAVLTDTIFYERSLQLFVFDFGISDAGRDIGRDILDRAAPSLAVAAPSFVLGMGLAITVGLGLALFRYSTIDRVGVVVLVVMLSISGMFYIVFGQWFFAKMLALVPVSGYAAASESALSAWRFLILPLVIGLIAGLGGHARMYRTFFIEEADKDYVRTARAKGLSEWAVMTRHVLRNALIPILTGAVAVIPLLFTGSLLMESFFGIPGLGSYVIEAINAQDFAIVRAMVFLGAALTVLGYTLTDISYAWADPRIKIVEAES